MSASCEVDIDIEAEDEASGVIDGIQDSIDRLGSSAESTSGSMDGLSNSSDSTSESMSGLSDSSDDVSGSMAISAVQVIGLAYGMSTALRGIMQFEQMQQKLALGQQTLASDTDTLDQSLYQYTGNQALGIQLTDEQNAKNDQANTLLEQYGGTLEEAGLKYQALEAAKGVNISLSQAEIAVANQLDSETQKVTNDQNANSTSMIGMVSSAARVALGLGQVGVTAAMMLGILGPGSSGLGGALSSVAGWLGIGGNAAEGATESFDGLASAFADMTPEAAVAGDAAVDVAGGLTLVGVAAGAVVVGVAAAAGLLIGTGAALVQAHQAGESYIQTYSAWAANIHATMPGIGGDVLAAAGMVSAGWLQMASDVTGVAEPALQNAWTSISTGATKASTDFSLDVSSMAQAIETIPARVSSVASSISSSLGSDWSTITTGAASAFGSVAADIAAIPTTVTTTVEAVVAAAISDFQQVVGIIGSILTSIVTTVTANVDSGISAIQSFLQWVDQIPSEITTQINAYASGMSGSFNGIPQFQMGGMVPETGIYYLHAQEEVLTPAQQAAIASPTGGASASAGSIPGTIQFQNQTYVQLNGQTIAQISEQKMIRARKFNSTYRSGL
jgi:hypothetical protein